MLKNIIVKMTMGGLKGQTTSGELNAIQDSAYFEKKDTLQLAEDFKGTITDIKSYDFFNKDHLEVEFQLYGLALLNTNEKLATRMTELEATLSDFHHLDVNLALSTPQKEPQFTYCV